MAIFLLHQKDFPYTGTWYNFMDNFSAEASSKTARIAIEAADLRLMTINSLL